MLPIVLMLILPGLAEDPVAALEGMGRVRHACTRQMADLDAAVAERPGDRAVALERGLCLHAVGRNDQALTALQAALSGARLGALVEASPDAAQGAVVVGVLLAWRGETGAARGWLRGLKGALGAEHPGTRRAAILLQAVEGDDAEAWAAARTLWQGQPDDPHAQALIAELTARDPDGAPPWAREMLSRPARTLSRTNRAVGLLTGGRFGDCVTLVDETLAEAREAAEIRRLHILGHRCGAHGGDLRAANTHMLKLRDLAALDGQAVLAHADLLATVGKVADALRLVELAQPDDPRGADTRRVRWNLALDRLDAAVDAAAAGAASAESRATLGLALHKAGRDSDARAVLEPACADLDRGAKRDCEDLIGRLEAP